MEKLASKKLEGEGLKQAFNFLFVGDAPPSIWVALEFLGAERLGAVGSVEGMKGRDYACYPAIIIGSETVIPRPAVFKKGAVLDIVVSFFINQPYHILLTGVKVEDNLKLIDLFSLAMGIEPAKPNNEKVLSTTIKYKNFDYLVIEQGGKYIVKNTAKGNMELKEGTRKKAIVKLFKKQQENTK